MRNKSLNLIISLLEKRDISKDKEILLKIMRNLSPSLLEKHLIKVNCNF
jgi:hypothetical protein